MANRTKVLFARLSLDGHDRGLICVLSACRDAGMEAIYIHYNAPEEVAKTAQEEDVDVIGLTSSMGEHFHVASGVLDALRELELDIPLIIGGVIPTVDDPKLLRMGVRAVFGPGSAPAEAVGCITRIMANKAGRG